MKQQFKNGDEQALVSKWRKFGITTRKAGGWRKIKTRLAKRFRKDGKQDLKNVS